MGWCREAGSCALPPCPAGGGATMPRGLHSRRSMLQHTIRASRLALGLALVLVGLVLALPGIPGPRLLVMFVGLTLLSTEFAWSRRLRDRPHRVFRRGGPSGAWGWGRASP